MVDSPFKSQHRKHIPIPNYTKETLTRSLTTRLLAQKGPTCLVKCQSWNSTHGDLDPSHPLTYVTVKVYHRHVTPLLSRRPQRT